MARYTIAKYRSSGNATSTQRLYAKSKYGIISKDNYGAVTVAGFTIKDMPAAAAPLWSRMPGGVRILACRRQGKILAYLALDCDAWTSDQLILKAGLNLVDREPVPREDFNIDQPPPHWLVHYPDYYRLELTGDYFLDIFNKLPF